MVGFGFNTELVQAIAEHRTALATAVFQLFTLLGEIEGYILVVAVIYACGFSIPVRPGIIGLFHSAIDGSALDCSPDPGEDSVSH